MKFRILYFSGNGFPSSDSDPRGVFSLEHAKALEAEGADVTAIDLRSDGFSDDDVVEGLRIRRLPRLRPLVKTFHIPKLVTYLQTLWKIRSDAQYDCIVFSFFYSKYLPLVLFFKRRNTKTMIIAHGGDVMPVRGPRRLVKKLLYKAVDLVTPVSDYTETLLSCLVDRRNRDSRKIVTVYNGVDLVKLRQVNEPRDSLRARWAVANDEFVILSVCNLVKRKGVDILIRSVNELLKKGLCVRHFIVGSGPERDLLSKLAREGGHPECFHFIPSLRSTELADFYNMADLYSMISITDWDREETEGFGISYAEAMVHGKPVVGGGGCGSTTPIKHGFNGLLVDPNSDTVVHDVAAALFRFINDKDFYARTSANAKWYVENFVSWPANAKATLAALQRVGSPAGEAAADHLTCLRS